MAIKKYKPNNKRLPVTDQLSLIMSTVIKIENLYKEYRLGVIGHGTLYRDLQSWWAKLKGKEDPNTLIGRSNYNRNKEEQILALDDINLEIKDGLYGSLYVESKVNTAKSPPAVTGIPSQPHS